MALNAHRVFSGTTDNNYLTALSVDPDKEGQLRKVRDAVRETLRGAFRQWSEHTTMDALFEAAAASQAALQPKFRMQGSFAYRTLNEPAQKPQEIDLDDGMFLPVSYLADQGGSHPALIHTGYFAVVESALARLCSDNDWELETHLPSCVRIRLDDGAHMDIALYAIPDAEFEVLVEKAAFDAHDRLAVLQSTDFSEGMYRQLDANQIMLAHREEGWKPSDPRKLDDWVQEGVNAYGAQFRRICRYLKGWRDHQWPACRLASIALMACAREAFDAAPAIADNRDDLRLLDVADRLPNLLRQQIDNPVVDGQRLDEKWTPEQRADFVARAEELAARVRQALQGTDAKQAALNELITAFGTRIPNDISLISTDDPNPPAVASPAVLKMGLLGEMAERAQEREAVSKDGDGRYG
jgi:hypothetical protein